MEAGAQGERRHDKLDGGVGEGGVAGKPGARNPRGKAGVLPGIEHRIDREHHERADERADEVVGDKTRVQALDRADRPGKEACRQAEDNGADNDDGNRPGRHIGNAGDDVALVLGAQGKRRKVAGK